MYLPELTNKSHSCVSVSERVGVELRERYGDSSLSDEAVAGLARQEMLARMQVTLAAEGVDVDVSDVTAVMEQMSRRNRCAAARPPLYCTL